MFKRDIRVNYEILDDILNDMRVFYASLEDMEEAMKRLDSLLLESSGETIEALKKKKDESLEVIGKYKEQIEEVSNLLNGYIWNMTGIIKPINRSMMTQVDRNDIWWNIMSIYGGVEGHNSQGRSMVPQRPYRDYVDDKKAEYNRDVINHNEISMESMEDAMLSLYKALTTKADELISIHNKKVIPYEDKDDEYDYKAKIMGDRYQDFWGAIKEGLTAPFEFIWKSATGLLHGAWNVVSGLFMLVVGVVYTTVAGVSWLVCKMFSWDIPEWVSMPLDSINSILKDPMLIIEGMLQRYSDVGDVKGYDYLAFMIGGEVLTTKAISELIKLLKNVSGFKGTRNPDADFVNGSKLTDHSGRHGPAFGYTTEQQYLKGARDFFNNPPKGIESFTSNGGTYFQYDAATNTFGIINEYGGISTYMKPYTGITYWLEQMAKYMPK